MPRHRHALLLLAGVLLLWGAGLALVMAAARLPPEAEGAMVALFPPWSDPDARFRALLAADGRPVEPMLGGLAWAVAGDEPGLAGRLERQGAVLVVRSLPFVTGLGCDGPVRAIAVPAPSY